MKNLFDALETLLMLSDPDEKLQAFSTFYKGYQKDSYLLDDEKQPEDWDHASYASWCTVVKTHQVNPRKNLTDQDNLAAFLHAILHIEYTAIDLALDAAYRFRGLPSVYYRDWIEVADDEARHYKMIRDLLKQMGYKHGDFAVHPLLFEMMMRSKDSLVARMALIPRSFEANGLDAHVKMADKIRSIRHPLKEAILEALDTIRREEIDHVRKGDRWFRYGCEREGKDPSCYFDIVEAISPDAVKKKAYINVEDRKKAGFTCDEIRRLSLRTIECGDHQ